jgi:DNA-binding LytR/AlgR family response regulator
MKVLIVEDEIVIAIDLMQMLSSNGYEVAGPAVDYQSALGLLNYEQPDLVLLDINLIGPKDGIDLATTIHESYDLPFIFTSALSDAATIQRASATQPATYLVKPFREEQLLAAIAVALTNFSSRQGFSAQQEDDHLMVKEAIFIKEKKSFLKISIADILYLKAADNYVEVCTKDKKYLVRSSLTDFMTKLNHPNFFKTHKSYVVNLAHLSSIHPTEVEVADFTIPLAKSYVTGLLEKVQHF